MARQTRQSSRNHQKTVPLLDGGDTLACKPVERHILRITRSANYQSQVVNSVVVKIYKKDNTTLHNAPSHDEAKSAKKHVSRSVVQGEKENKCSRRKARKRVVLSLSDSDADSDLDFTPSKTTRKSKKSTSRKPKAKGPESNKSDDQKYKLTKEKKKTKALTKEEAIETALDRLHSFSVPDSLPCRESQFADIYNFVEQKLMNGEGGCMYISGVPGTGKTTTLYEVQRKLEQCEDLPPFKFIEINGVRLGDPKQFYPHLLMELTGEKRSISQALNALNERFTDGKPSKKFTVLLVDELDFLRTKTQNLLYNVFDWPTKQNSRLIVLAIANTMDLPERFMLKFSSRIAFTRLSFQPYNFKELEQIVRTRLTDLGPSDVFEPDALQLICRKVAALSGDARRVLDICRRSAEITIADKRVLVTMRDVDKALQEIFNSIKISRIRFASTQEQIFLRALIQDFRMSGLEEARFLDIYKSHIEICRFEGHYVPSTTELTKVATNLDLSKIILFQKSPSHLYRRVSLNISTDDITFALNLGDD